MSGQRKFILDTNVFVQSNRVYYPIEVFPGFWNMILIYHQSSVLFSLDRVRTELKGFAVPDPITEWIDKEVPTSFFLDSNEEAVINEYNRCMNIAQGLDVREYARENFARDDLADPWLIAFAAAQGFVVVTGEKADPNIKKKIQVPNMCTQMGVDCIDQFKFLKELGVKFDLRQ